MDNNEVDNEILNEANLDGLDTIDELDKVVITDVDLDKVLEQLEKECELLIEERD